MRDQQVDKTSQALTDIDHFVFSVECDSLEMLQVTFILPLSFLVSSITSPLPPLTHNFIRENSATSPHSQEAITSCKTH